MSAHISHGSGSSFQSRLFMDLLLLPCKDLAEISYRLGCIARYLIEHGWYVDTNLLIVLHALHVEEDRTTDIPSINQLEVGVGDSYLKVIAPLPTLPATMLKPRSHAQLFQVS
jgi:hypothetical protein